MQLSTLLNNIATLPKEYDLNVEAITLDSRKVTPGTLFLALRGTKLLGSEFIEEAISRGASAVLVESTDGAEIVMHEKRIPIISVPNLRQQVSLFAGRFYHEPTKKLQLIGVTGTNGKTSCTHFLAEALHALQQPCGIIGTLGVGFYGNLQETGLTTPDAVTLQATFAQLVKQGAKAVAMEVSSHSIDQGRVNDLTFEVGIFTNLTQDHLDYHGTLENYAAVKHRFIADFPLRHLVINADDAYGREWLQTLTTKPSLYAYGTQAEPPAGVPYIHAKQQQLSLHGIEADITTPWGDGTLHLPLIGQFNLSNALAVLTALCAMGFPFERVVAALAQIHPVPGRMQTVGGKQGQPLIVVDYAHTPDALSKVLEALKAHTKGRLICVFGCGGDRDPGKRPIMASIAETFADQVIVTNDNPRHESETAIANAIKAGFSRPNKVIFELDRSKAIQKSIQLATEHDCILIAGKGAEHYQQIGDQKLPFDDVAEVQKVFAIS